MHSLWRSEERTQDSGVKIFADLQRLVSIILGTTHSFSAPTSASLKLAVAKFRPRLASRRDAVGLCNEHALLRPDLTLWGGMSSKFEVRRRRRRLSGTRAGLEGEGIHLENQRRSDQTFLRDRWSQKENEAILQSIPADHGVVMANGCRYGSLLEECSRGEMRPVASSINVCGFPEFGNS